MPQKQLEEGDFVHLVLSLDGEMHPQKSWPCSVESQSRR